MPPSARPGPHPGPPADFATRVLPLVAVAGPLYRVHRRQHHPLHFGRSGDNRFDDVQRRYGVLYAATTPEGAFIETFAEPLQAGFVTLALLDARKLSTLSLSEPLRLVDLDGRELRRLGADARLLSGPHEVAQRWSRAAHEHPQVPDGLRYPARHDPTRYAVALFERARSRLSAQVAGEVLGAAANRALLAGLLERYGLGLL